MFRRFICGFAAAVFLIGTAAAAEPHTYTYSYDYWGNGVISPDGYTASEVFTADFKKPADLFIANGLIYVADAGNNRIVALNTDGSSHKIYSDFLLDGQPSPLSGPQGIFVNAAGELLIADTGNSRIVRADSQGNILSVFTEPEGGAGFNFTGIDYLPLKVTEDQSGNIYVLCRGVFQGALMYTPDGVLTGYYGAAQVAATLQLLNDMLWRRFMTEEQRQKTRSYVPVEYNNFFVDGEGFIYTCTETSVNGVNQIRKLNAKGVNVLPASDSVSSAYQNRYGDLRVRYGNGYGVGAKLTDVTVDDAGFITALDYERGRIFQYDSQSNLLLAFGGIGDQIGSFRKPVSIEQHENKLYVLDETKGDITVFSLTPYGELLHSAVIHYNNDETAESEEVWTELLKQNRNLNLAYIAIGKIYYEKGDYTSAMSYFKKGEDRTDYGNAFRQSRNIFLRQTVFPAIGIIIALGAVFYILKKILTRNKNRKAKEKAKNRNSFIKMCFYTMTHPAAGFNAIKEQRMFSVKYSMLILTALFAAKACEHQLTGFSFNQNDISRFNIFMLLFQVFGLCLLWSAANWAISTLFDGKGRLKEIWVFTSIATLPYTLSVFLNVILSNILAPDEGMFLQYIAFAGLLWSILMLAAGLMLLHDYSLPRVIWSSGLSIACMVIAVFMGVLFMSLFQQIFGFSTDIFNELTYRF